MPPFHKVHQAPAGRACAPDPIQFFTRGNDLLTSGKFSEAIEQYRHTLVVAPQMAEAHNNIGIAWKRQNRLDEAGAAFQQAIAVRGDYVEAYVNLGDALRLLERFEDSRMCLKAALEIDADCAEAHNNLGIVHSRLGDFEQAEACFQRAVQLRPDYADARNNLGNLQSLKGQFEEAEENYHRAASQGNQLDAHNHLGLLHQKEGRLTEAAAEYYRALEIDEKFVHAWVNLGVLRQYQGRIEDAQRLFRKAVQLQPRFEKAHSNFLISLGYDPDVTPDDFYAEHIRWREQQTAHLHRYTDHANNPNPTRRLKIGYVSPDFRAHPVAAFMEPILRYHNRRNVEVICYSDVAIPDKITERFTQLSDQWRKTCGKSHEELVDIILNDQIDILVDLSGHTAGNRLLVFARKPAPVQFSFLGYGNTTGLTAIDYRITDNICDPSGEPDYYVEKLVRLPAGHFCFLAPESAPAVQPPPVLKNRFVTFGSFNNLAKIGEEVITLWSRILTTIPNSRILLKNGALEDAATCDRYREMFAAHGVSPDRVELRGFSLGADAHLAGYHDVDIALDPFPYTGATTTCEAIWMGVPVVTLRGGNYVGRMSASILSTAGCGHLIADAPEQYHSTAIGLASDIEQLSDLRAGLRKLVTSSPLSKGGVTTDLETEYRRAWQLWCRGRD